MAFLKCIESNYGPDIITMWRHLVVKDINKHGSWFLSLDKKDSAKLRFIDKKVSMEKNKKLKKRSLEVAQWRIIKISTYVCVFYIKKISSIKPIHECLEKNFLVSQSFCVKKKQKCNAGKKCKSSQTTKKFHCLSSSTLTRFLECNTLLSYCTNYLLVHVWNSPLPF